MARSRVHVTADADAHASAGLIPPTSQTTEEQGRTVCCRKNCAGGQGAAGGLGPSLQLGWVPRAPVTAAGEGLGTRAEDAKAKTTSPKSEEDSPNRRFPSTPPEHLERGRKRKNMNVRVPQGRGRDSEDSCHRDMRVGTWEPPGVRVKEHGHLAELFLIIKHTPTL